MSHTLASSSSHHVLEVFTTQISTPDSELISQALTRSYNDFLQITAGKELTIPPNNYHSQRGQYQADLLITHLLKVKTKDYALWIITGDLYTNQMNFIFGLARYYQGAVLSLRRLHTNDLKAKEAIHETGHILGLPHCKNPCVMQYSNSLWDARHKPQQLCDNCRQQLTR